MRCFTAAILAAAAAAVAAGSDEAQLATSSLRSGVAAAQQRELLTLSESDTLCLDEAHVGKIQVRVPAARSLTDLDTGADTSDPYVRVTFRGDTKTMTGVEVDTSSPTWAADVFVAFCVVESSLDSSVKVELFDRDFVGTDPSLGSVTFQLRSYVNPATDTTARLATGLALTGSNAGSGVVDVDVRLLKTVDLTAAYLDAVPNGSIVLFRSLTSGGLVIRAGTRSLWSHVGFVARDGRNRTMVLEASSNLAGMSDCFDGSQGDGVEALGLRDKAQSGIYNAIGIRPLVAPNAAAAAAWNETLWRLYFQYQTTPYEYENAQMFLGTFNWNDEADRSSLFCSEYTALVMQEAGILTSSDLENNFHPAEFSSDNPKALSAGWSWGQEVYLRGSMNWTDGFCYTNPEQCMCGSQSVSGSSIVASSQDTIESVITYIIIGCSVGGVLLLACIGYCVWRFCWREPKTAQTLGDDQRKIVRPKGAAAADDTVGTSVTHPQP